MSGERLSVFPAFHKVADRVVLVVGAGDAAKAKVRLLLETEAKIRLVAAEPDATLAELVAAHAMEHRAREFEDGDLDDAVLVFAASGERDADATVVAAARARNIPANAVDIPELCDFYTPAIVNRAPIAVAITSTGAGPVLAQKLRARIEAMLPNRLGALRSARRLLPPERRTHAPEGTAAPPLLVGLFRGKDRRGRARRPHRGRAPACRPPSDQRRLGEPAASSGWSAPAPARPTS